MPELQDDWVEYRRLVLDALARIDRQVVALSAKIDDHDDIRSREISDLRVEVGMLKVRTMIYGGLIGTAASIIVSVVLTLLRGH